MPKTEMIRARIEPDLKKEVENIFSELGLSPTSAITLFYQQVRLFRGLPFSVRIPNEITLKTFRDTDAEENLIQCNDAADMFKKSGI